MLFVQSSTNQLDNEISFVRSRNVKDHPSSFESETWRALTSDFKVWQLIYKTKYSNVTWSTQLNLSQFHYKYKELVAVEDGPKIVIEDETSSRGIRAILEAILPP